MIVNRPGQVYAIMFPDGSRYIGITSQPLEKRFKDHLSQAKTPCRNSTKFYEALRTVSEEELKIVSLARYENRDEGEELEQLAIQAYDSIQNGYNTSIGGSSPINCLGTPEFIEKVSKAQRIRFSKEEERQKSSIKRKEWIKNNPEKVSSINENRRKTLTSDEHRNKMSDTMRTLHQKHPQYAQERGKTLSERYKTDSELKNRISKALGGGEIEVLRNGEVIATYPSMGTAGKELGVSVGNIGSVLVGRRNHTGGYQFRRKINEDLG